MMLWPHNYVPSWLRCTARLSFVSFFTSASARYGSIQRCVRTPGTKKPPRKRRLAKVHAAHLVVGGSGITGIGTTRGDAAATGASRATHGLGCGADTLLYLGLRLHSTGDRTRWLRTN